MAEQCVVELGGKPIADKKLREEYADKITSLKALDPTASSATSITFIDTISQTDGLIAATKKTIPMASSSVPGLTKVVSTYSSNGTDAVNGSAIAEALNTLDVADTAIADNYVSQVTETNGKITVTRTSLLSSLKNVIKQKTVDAVLSASTSPLEVNVEGANLVLSVQSKTSAKDIAYPNGTKIMVSTTDEESTTHSYVVTYF